MTETQYVSARMLVLASARNVYLKRLEHLPPPMVQILDALPEKAAFALASVLTKLRELPTDTPESATYELRGQVRGHAEAAFMREEIDEPGQDILNAYASGLPV